MKATSFNGRKNSERKYVNSNSLDSHLQRARVHKSLRIKAYFFDYNTVESFLLACSILASYWDRLVMSALPVLGCILLVSCLCGMSMPNSLWGRWRKSPCTQILVALSNQYSGKLRVQMTCWPQESRVIRIRYVRTGCLFILCLSYKKSWESTRNVYFSSFIHCLLRISSAFPRPITTPQAFLPSVFCYPLLHPLYKCWFFCSRQFVSLHQGLPTVLQAQSVTGEHF